jgi:hypothetical protein
MKYIKDFDYIVENKRNAKRFKNKGGLMKNDQFSGNVSLSKTLADELGFDLKKEYSEGVGFDGISMYDTASGKTIIEDALSGKHTYDDLVKVAKEWYKKNESVNENAKATAKEIFDELMDVNGEEIADMDKSECMYTLKMRGITGGEAARVCKELLKMTSSIGESVDLNEAKKFKPGDMWSNDFDYEGMLKYGLKVNEKTPIKMLNKLFDSATDVNYHTPFRNLGIAIDWIEDGDKKGAKDYIKNFHDDIKKEMKNQGIK